MGAWVGARVSAEGCRGRCRGGAAGVQGVAGVGTAVGVGVGAGHAGIGTGRGAG